MNDAAVEPRYISQAEISRKYRISRSYLNKLEKTAEDFPKVVAFFSRQRRYVRTEVERWFNTNEHNPQISALFGRPDDAEKKAVKDNEATNE